ncbi:hypothetical protein DPMN_117998 [Dreissena polymorpha]|uniref:Uncharacterized protein n=1 Tax=Dreissena polymorpha TaxID=45954 RepID=A0A9D4GMB6_DREPO|nr:hypothetical protein DPMN_117998 [Dreissena polymorpha]
MRSPPEFTGSDYASTSIVVTSTMTSPIDTGYEDGKIEEIVSIRTNSNFSEGADVFNTRIINVKPYMQSISAKSRVDIQYKKQYAGDMKTEDDALKGSFHALVNLQN